MRSALLVAAGLLAAMVFIGMPEAQDRAPSDAGAAAYPIADSLSPAEAFASIEDARSRSIALFNEMAKVLTHPRCMNCHPRSDIPSQGDDRRAHHPLVVRGVDGFGAAGMRCSTCHQAGNVAYLGADGSIPGNAHWHLAPLSMGWQGMTVAEICEQIKDPARNGDRSLADLVTHHSEDALVGWAWTPGEGRTPAPGSWERFGDLTAAWVEAGAACPD